MHIEMYFIINNKKVTTGKAVTRRVRDEMQFYTHHLGVQSRLKASWKRWGWGG